MSSLVSRAGEGTAFLAHPPASIHAEPAARPIRFSHVALVHTTVPGAILLGALVFAPWFWGCNWPLGIAILDGLLLTAITSWSLGILLRGRPTGLPLPLLLTVLALLVFGWFMALNARSTCDFVTGDLLPSTGHLAVLPGSVDQPRSRDGMIRLSGLLGAAVVAAWIGRDRAWRRRFLWTIAVTAASITLLGCAQRWTGTTDIFWGERHLDFFFGTYRNVTNAGEYLNFALPLAAALTLNVAWRGRSPWMLAAGAATTLLIVAGCFVCGSKIAPIVACASAVIFVFFHRASFRVLIGRAAPSARFITTIVLLLILFSVIQGAGLGTARDRWSRLWQDDHTSATLSNRLLVDRVCLIAAPDAGLLGFGPSGFRAIFPYYSGLVDGDLRGVWTFAHDDYLQTELEWGALGAGLWSVYFFGAILLLARASRLATRSEDRFHTAGLLQSLVVIAFMSFVDFPLQIASIQLDVALALGLAWSSSRWVNVACHPCNQAVPNFLAQSGPEPTLRLVR